MKKENKGITLIALVITIIILLILAAITINLTIGQRGILRRAEEVGRNYVKAAEEEDKQLANLLGEIDKKENGSDNEGGNEDSNYYGGLDVLPTDTKYFEFVLNEETKTAKLEKIKDEYAQIEYYKDISCVIGMIDGDKEITEVIIPYSVTKDGQNYIVTELEKNIFSCKFNEECVTESKFTNIILPNTIEIIGGGVFSYCQNLTNITIPDRVKSIESFAFGNCTKLTSVVISNGVKHIGDGVFYNCRRLTNITIPNSVTSIGIEPFYSSYDPNITVTLEKGSTLEIPEDKWGAKQVIREQ